MNSKKVYFILIGVLVLLGVLGIGSVIVGNRLLASSANRLNDLKLQTSVIDEQQNSLTKARQDIEDYADLETIAKTIVPQEKDQARTVREIVKFAEETNVPITSITFPTSELGQTKTNSKGKKTSASSTPPPLSQLTEVEGLKGVYQLEVTVANDQTRPVSYSSLIKFLEKLEQNRRTSQVSNVSLEPLADNRNLLTYSMIINVYIKP